jgi:DNA-binding response OmpR family regulator
MYRIILVEDHERLATLVCKKLSIAGIAVDVFERIDTAWAALQKIPYQALILDRGLPDGDGLILLKRLLQANHNIPCLILTARDILHDRVEGLEAGADDYLPKPFEMEEMVARVRALLRRPAVNIILEPQYHDICIKPETSVMCCHEQQVKLAPAELQIMLLFVQKKGEVIRHHALEAAGWGLSEAVTPNALDVVLHRLRKKLGVIDSSLGIVNMRNLGYALREIAVVKKPEF